MKCNYPGCKKEHTDNHFLELINKKGSSVNLPFCRYHFYIVMGGHFKVKSLYDPIEQIFELIGPLREVEITEQVIASREMIAAQTEKEKLTKLKSDNKNLNKKEN